MFDILLFFISAGAAYYSWGIFTGVTKIIPSLLILLSAWCLISFFTADPKKRNGKRVVCRIGNLYWTMEDFVRGWLVTGKTGSGKTSSGLCTLLSEVFKNVPEFGSLFIASKGLEQDIIIKMCNHFKVPDKVLVVRTRTQYDPDFIPQYFSNLIGDNRILEETYAASIIDTAESQGRIGTGGASDHFKGMAYLHIKNGITMYRLLGEAPTLYKLYQILTSKEGLEKKIEEIAKKSDVYAAQNKNFESDICNAIYNDFVEKFLDVPEEEQGGIRTTITNVLEAYTHPALREVYSSEKPNVDIRMVDQGKIICVSTSPEFARSKSAIDTLWKLQFYSHGMARAALPEKKRYIGNLLLFIADECQKLLTKSEQGMCDHKAVAETREYNVTGIYLTQGETAIVTKLGKDTAGTLIMNLSNELIYKAANNYGAEEASIRLGEKKGTTQSKSWGKGGSSTSHQEAWKPKVHKQELKDLKKFTCYAVHCEKGYQKVTLPPTQFTVPSSQDADCEAEPDLPEVLPLAA
jgi:hypothetical protein